MDGTTPKFKSVIIAVLMGLITMAPAKVNAEEVVCQVVYGQGEICGVKTEEQVLGVHAPVEAGIEDVRFVGLASGAAVAALILFLLSKLSKRIYLLDR